MSRTPEQIAAEAMSSCKPDEVAAHIREAQAAARREALLEEAAYLTHCRDELLVNDSLSVDYIVDWLRQRATEVGRG